MSPEDFVVAKMKAVGRGAKPSDQIKTNGGPSSLKKRNELPATPRSARDPVQRHVSYESLNEDLTRTEPAFMVLRKSELCVFHAKAAGSCPNGGKSWLDKGKPITVAEESKQTNNWIATTSTLHIVR